MTCARISRRDSVATFAIQAAFIIHPRERAQLRPPMENASNYGPKKRPFSHDEHRRENLDQRGRPSNSIVRLDPLLRAGFA